MMFRNRNIIKNGVFALDRWVGHSRNTRSSLMDDISDFYRKAVIPDSGVRRYRTLYRGVRLKLFERHTCASFAEHLLKGKTFGEKGGAKGASGAAASFTTMEGRVAIRFARNPSPARHDVSMVLTRTDVRDGCHPDVIADVLIMMEWINENRNLLYRIMGSELDDIPLYTGREREVLLHASRYGLANIRRMYVPVHMGVPGCGDDMRTMIDMFGVDGYDIRRAESAITGVVMVFDHTNGFLTVSEHPAIDPR